MSKDFLGKLDLAKFIQNVEKMANEGTPNGKIDTTKEKSIFGQELNKYAQANNLSDEDVNQIWGLALSEQTESAQNAPEKTKSTRAASGPDIVIIDGNEYNFTININVQNDFKSAIDDFLNGGGIDKIINLLIEHMGDLGDKVLNALIQIINEQFGDKLDYSEIKDLLNKIIDKLDQQNQQIGDLNGKIDDLQKQLIYYAEQNLKLLNNLGLQMDTLIDSVKTSNENQEKQYELMNEIYNVIMDLMEKSNDMSVNLQEFTNIIANAIKNGEVKMDEVISLLKGIKQDTSDNKEISTNILEVIKKFGSEGIALGNQILDAVKNLGDKGTEFANEVLTLLKNNNVELGDIKNLLAQVQQDTSENKELSQDILEVLKDINQSIGILGNDIMVQLTKIMGATQMNGVILDEIKDLLESIKKDTSENKETSKKILAAIEKLGTDTAGNFSAVLTAINELKENGGNNVDLEALLDKVVSNLSDSMKEQTKEIIEAMANIEVVGGNVDLSSLEKMMSELVELTKDNNGLLSDIDAKLDALKLTASSIEAKLSAEFDKNDERYKSIMNVLNVIQENQDKYDDTKMLESLDKLLAKLDDILDAIQDHKVVVDITGKVTCECDCGNKGSHEGIIDNLNSIMSFKAEMTGIGNVQQDRSDATGRKIYLNSSNKYGVPSGTYIKKGNDLYNLQGQVVKHIEE